MPLTQPDIRQHYEQAWRQKLDSATSLTDLTYSSPIEDAILYPIYESVIRDDVPRLGAAAADEADGDAADRAGSILDVGCGSGRWTRFLLSRFRPCSYLGVDFAQSSIDLLNRWVISNAERDIAPAPPPPPPPAPAPPAAPDVAFQVADITEPELDLGRTFDLINIANVLFHIPEQDRFDRAIKNLSTHLAPGGRIVTTEYLPRNSMRTKWMLVRSRYEFEAALAAHGLRILRTRATGFFNNDPMGVDGPNTGVRGRFQSVRARTRAVLESDLPDQTRAFMVDLFVEIERSLLEFCAERLADVEMPSQKLVVIGRA